MRTVKTHCWHKTPICAYFLNHILCDSILTCILSIFVRATCIYIQCQTVCGEKTHQCGNMVQSGFVRNSLCRMKSCFEMSGRKNLWYRHSLKTPWVMKTDWLLCCFGPLAFIALLLLPLIQCLSSTDYSTLIIKAAFILSIILHRTPSWFSLLISAFITLSLSITFVHWPKYMFLWYNVYVLFCFGFSLFSTMRSKWRLFFHDKHMVVFQLKEAVSVEAVMSLNFPVFL